MYDISYVVKYFPYFLPAAWMTLQISVIGIIFGLVLGLVTALGKLSALPVFRITANIYIYLIRGTPLLLQIMFVYYGLVRIVDLSPFTSGALALGVHNGAYIAEIFRGAIQSIDRGQMEAARSLGMPHWKAMQRIILPQAFKRAIPPLGNQFIIALKDSSLASAITISELLLKAQQLAASTFRMMEMLTIAGIFYLIYTSFFTLLLHRLESRLRYSERYQGGLKND
jgi:polar amino acid transport system permease protein